jgi:2-keto-3-deoxy-L-fuconate dehydrogenase
MPFRLDGKIALITGAGQGIGRATALLFADEGATVFATDVNADALDALAAERDGIEAQPLDVLDGDAIHALAKAIGTVDVLFNCAGWVHSGDLLHTPIEGWQRSFDLNVTAMFHTCQAFLPGMLEAGRGSIINMSSAVSSIKGVPNRLAYGASKAAVIGLTKAIAADYIGKGIRCNALCPGTTDTPSLHDRMSAGGDADAVRAAFVARQPMGRFGTPDEIAAAALYLASDESAFMTGHTLVIDGGMTL